MKTLTFIIIKALSHQKKLQIAEVRAVHSPATLWKRCDDAVQ